MVKNKKIKNIILILGGLLLLVFILKFGNLFAINTYSEYTHTEGCSYKIIDDSIHLNCVVHNPSWPHANGVSIGIDGNDYEKIDNAFYNYITKLDGYINREGNPEIRQRHGSLYKVYKDLDQVKGFKVVRGSEVEEFLKSNFNFVCGMTDDPSVQSYYGYTDLNRMFGDKYNPSYVCVSNVKLTDGMFYNKLNRFYNIASCKINNIKQTFKYNGLNYYPRVVPLCEMSWDGKTTLTINNVEFILPYKEIKISQPLLKPRPKGFSQLLIRIWDKIKAIFEKISPRFSIVGEKVIEVGKNYTYQIELRVPPPDLNWSDGTYQVQYASWALIDKNKNIIQEGEWEEINGTYLKNITIKAPENVDDYLIIAMVTQFDMNYNTETKSWDTSEEKIILLESINLRTTKPTIITKPSKPSPKGIISWINSVLGWFSNLFNKIFGEVL